ncbi:hypothetical protein [uncultured Chryseobacterium sp.]|uniref:hypothetical protein n=1 Tax=uncultured Chryseobacterium sp. TaxID=259322 RepID=UPI00374A46F9
MAKLRFIPFLQAVYYFVTGLWPLVHLKSFFEVTGPKTDVWLVQMVGALIFSYSILFFYMALTRQLLHIHAVVGSLSSFAIGCIEFYYYLQGTLRGVYYVGFIIETCFFMYWICYLIYHHRQLREA